MGLESFDITTVATTLTDLLNQALNLLKDIDLIAILTSIVDFIKGFMA